MEISIFKKLMFLTLLFFGITSCGEVKRESVSFKLNFLNASSSQTFNGGVFLYAKEKKGLEVKELLEYPFEHGFTEGDWSFYVVTYDGTDLFKGTARCGSTSDILLNEESLNEETEVEIKIKESNCNTTEAQTLISMLCQYFNTTVSASNSCSNVAIPLTVGDLELWLDGQDTATLFQDSSCTTAVNEVNQSVKCWKSKVNSYNASGLATSSTFPKITKDIYSDEFNTFLESNAYFEVSNIDFDFPTGMEIFLVFQYKTNSSSGPALDWHIQSDSSDPLSVWSNILIHNGSSGLRVGDGSQYCNDSSRPFGENGANNNTHIMGISFAGNNDYLDIRKDGESPIILGSCGSTHSISSVNYGTDDDRKDSSGTLNDGLRIGKRGNYYSSQYAPGYYGEVLIFKGPLSESDRQKVEGYLACKWGLQSQLPSSHPYQSNCP